MLLSKRCRLLLTGLLRLTFWSVATCFLFIQAGNAETLRWATASDIQTLDPHAQNESLTNSFNAHIYEKLTARDASLKLVAGLAERWEQPDPLVWIFHLRKNISFHDSSAFDANDVVFSVERAQHANSAVSQYARALGSVKKLNDYTVEFRQTKFNPVFLDHLDAVFMMSKSWSEKHGVLYPASYKNKQESFASRNANGTGPYRLLSRAPDVRNVLRRNANYWRAFDGNVAELVHLPIASPSTRLAALLSREIDLVTDPSPQDLDRIEKMPGVTLKRGPENRVVFLGFDQWRPALGAKTGSSAAAASNPFLKADVRRAIAHAIDTDTLRQQIFKGNALPAWCLTPVQSGCVGPAALQVRPEFNLNKAKQLLADAGYQNGFDVTLDCPSNRHPNDVALCSAIAAMLAKVQIRVTVLTIPKAQFFVKLEKLESQFYLMGWGGAESDAQPTMEPLMHTFDEKTGRGDDNYGRFSNARLDALIEASSKETSFITRQSLIGQALALHADEVHHLVLHRQALTWVMRSNVKVVHAANGHFRAWMSSID
jgi:peptide/nickel transport system substrate-binding protein